ncbi:MAG: hypothetical protein CL678_16075 [Bdellovibrionaceae bacterium]|nr:hypothetical protein [Pseudobdellovibrionaceae bacterium]|tara:strand:- start:1484 stop:1729 length:246 start_codon:yes stop_codon:yes gene_type:complete
MTDSAISRHATLFREFKYRTVPWSREGIRKQKARNGLLVEELNMEDKYGLDGFSDSIPLPMRPSKRRYLAKIKRYVSRVTK